MDEWGKIAGIVALATIPIYASPLILQPAFRKLRDIASQLYYRNSRCEAIQWQDLHNGPVRPSALRHGVSQTSNSQAMQANGAQDAEIPSQSKVIVEFLKHIWQTNPRLIARPLYLDVSKAYIRLDANVLLVLALLDGSSGAPDYYLGPTTSYMLSLGSAAARFRTFEKEDISYIIGTLQGLPRFEALRLGFHGLTKDDLRAIAGGYPPFYRRMLTSNSGSDIPHPVQSIRDIHRGGWVVAIGFAAAHSPLRVYNQKQAAAYSEACDRVLKTLQGLQRMYASEAAYTELLDLAVRVVIRMNGYRSGSGADVVTKGTVLLHGNFKMIGGRLSVPQLSFAIRVFDELREGMLSAEEREDFKPILVEALRAAVFGVFAWWQYVNNEGHEIPGWLLDERLRMTPIWIEDGSGREE